MAAEPHLSHTGALASWILPPRPCAGLLTETSWASRPRPLPAGMAPDLTASGIVSSSGASCPHTRQMPAPAAELFRSRTTLAQQRDGRLTQVRPLARHHDGHQVGRLGIAREP